jgi:hypothetical protein
VRDHENYGDQKELKDLLSRFDTDSKSNPKEDEQRQRQNCVEHRTSVRLSSHPESPGIVTDTSQNQFGLSPVIIHRAPSQLSIKRNFILDPSKRGEISPMSLQPHCIRNRVLLINRMILHFDIVEI